MKPRKLRVAIVAIGIGRVQRGFERVITDIFGVIRTEVDATLYKSGGTPSPHEKIPPLLRLLTAIARALPLGRLAGGSDHKEYKRDCLAFGFGMLPDLLRNRFDIIHVIDPPLALVLQRLQRIFRFHGQLLYSVGVSLAPQHYPQAAHLHQMTPVRFEQALEMGIPASHMTMVPIGVHTQRFAINMDRQEARRKHGISGDPFVVLVVSALERFHKRVDYVIEEVSRLDGDVLLWLDGNPEDSSIPALAREKLGPKCRITHVPSSDVPELYRLSDVMVQASLEEGFGLAVVEAISAGLMVLVHDSPHFEWLVQDHSCLIDMSVPGNLTTRLSDLAGKRQDLTSGVQARTENIRRRLDWDSLTAGFIEMYRKVAALNFSPANGDPKIAFGQCSPQGAWKPSAGPGAVKKLNHSAGSPTRRSEGLHEPRTP